jgi:hypothetical protein
MHAQSFSLGGYDPSSYLQATRRSEVKKDQGLVFHSIPFSVPNRILLQCLVLGDLEGPFHEIHHGVTGGQ